MSSLFILLKMVFQYLCQTYIIVKKLHSSKKNNEYSFIVTKYSVNILVLSTRSQRFEQYVNVFTYSLFFLIEGVQSSYKFDI